MDAFSISSKSMGEMIALSKVNYKILVDIVNEVIGDGSPKEVFDTFQELELAYPKGAKGIYLVAETGHWYFWHEEWIDGGVYQATELSDGSVTEVKLEIGLQNKIDLIPALLESVEGFDERLNKLLIHNGDGKKDSEIIDARGSAPVLSARLNGIDAQLADTSQYINQYSLMQQKSNRMIPLTFNSDTKHFSSYSGDKACNGIMTLDNAGNSGWVINYGDMISNRVVFDMPVAVIIGDSIAEGHPALHSRLHSGGGYVPDLPNSPGQISYHIEQYSKIKVYNHGIGGQRFDQVRIRWDRDVLAQTVSSLTPSNTLPKKPQFVIIVCGINDVFYPRSLEDIIADADYLIESALENNIYPIVFTIGPHYQMDSAKLATVKGYNAWLLDKGSKNPNMTVIDFYSYANNPSDDGKPKAGIFVDGVHPTKKTYEDLARKIINEAFTSDKPPAVPKYLNISTAMDLAATVTNAYRPTAMLLYINGKPARYYEMINDPNQVIKLPPVKGHIETISLEPQIAEVPYELPTNTGSYCYISEVYLSDVNLYPGHEIERESIIEEFPCVSGISRFYPAQPDDTTPGNMTFIATADATNCVGLFCVASADNKGYVVTKGLAIAKTSGQTYKGDLLVTSTSGRMGRNVNPTVGTVVAKVIKPGSEFCLVDII